MATVVSIDIYNEQLRKVFNLEKRIVELEEEARDARELRDDAIEGWRNNEAVILALRFAPESRTWVLEEKAEALLPEGSRSILERRRAEQHG